MIAVVQRVRDASVTIAEPAYRAAIGHGLCVLLGVQVGDTGDEASWVAAKLARLRIFRDEEDRMNRSVTEVGGSILVVSQFTLAADCSRGNRPSFVGAAVPAVGRRLYGVVCRLLREEHGLPVRTGRFGAMMDVTLTNDGPVTIIVEKRPG